MYNQIPYMMPNNVNTLLGGAGKSSLSSLLSKINISSILTNTQKTLSVVNQAIPLYYQVKPVVQNLRALGKIGKEFNNINTNNTNKVNDNYNNSNTNNLKTNINDYDIPAPTFYL